MTRTVYLDTETTGLKPATSEIVEIAILDEHGATLLDTLVRPTRAKTWSEAQAIHGISPLMVKDAPTLPELESRLLDILTDTHLVIYNAGYDVPFLPPRVRKVPAQVSCAMERFAPHGKVWNDYFGSWKWVKLDVAARIVGHTWTGEAHRARADADACRSVWLWLERQPEGAASVGG